MSSGYKAVSIVDIFKDVVTEMNKTVECYYLHGRSVEVSSILTSVMKTNTKTTPLVYLVENIEETPNPEDLTVSASLTIFIATTTKSTIRSEERHNTVFKPILYPIYEALIDAIIKNKDIRFEYGKEFPSHKKTDIPFADGDSLIANKSFDAIKIENLELKFVIKKC